MSVPASLPALRYLPASHTGLGCCAHAPARRRPQRSPVGRQRQRTSRADVRRTAARKAASPAPTAQHAPRQSLHRRPILRAAARPQLLLLAFIP